MAKASNGSCFIFLSIVFLQILMSHNADPQEERKTYIVYMGNHPGGELPLSNIHKNMLQEVLGSDGPPDALLHSYKRSFNGFVANLKKEEAKSISELESVLSVFENEKRELHTTRSWDFMDFPLHAKRKTVESDIIIGVIDTGILPQTRSFRDSLLGSPPTKWKGACHNITCNNKIIGAKYYRVNGSYGEDDTSPLDTHGHGSHTASIAAGDVTMASLYGLGSGTARGGVPSARIAVYKVCWHDGCHDADILAAFDDAIADGVDIISISMGFIDIRSNYFNDSIAIGAFHAMRKGILTSTSAGNDGPRLKTIDNFSPWSIPVAASTIDRKFLTKVQLGNRQTYEGVTINTYDSGSRMYPLIYGGNAPNTTGGFNSSISRSCINNSLDRNLVKGKIVICDGFSRATQVGFASGAKGIVMHSPEIRDVAYSYALPASYISTDDANSIRTYMNVSRNPNATIFKSNDADATSAPLVVSFSSRGPNPVTNDILKPDIAAPGVDILAAWSPKAAITGVKGDKRKANYNLLSGTSMACPHVTGTAAYIKSFHPTWSPAAIKSALMTTATPMTPALNAGAEFAYGSGHLNPIKALSPGLVYDAGEMDYVKFLCGQGYNTETLQLVTGRDDSFCTEVNNGTVWDLNYPSFAVSASPSTLIDRVFNRRVTNVGMPNSTHRAVLTIAEGLDIKVSPARLSFNSVEQKMSFQLRVQGSINSTIVSSALVWDDGTHKVRSPIVVFSM